MPDAATRYYENIHTPTDAVNPAANPPRLVKSYPGTARHSLPWPPEKSRHRLGRLLAGLVGINRSRWLTPLDLLPFDEGIEHRPESDPTRWLVTRRPTPSGGATYSAEWYVAAGPDSEVPTGVYYYDPARHDLVRLREGDYRAWAASRPTSTVLVQTSVFWRLAARYGEMYYRLACLETGVQVAQALAMAGETATARLCFPDADVTELLGLDPRREGAHAVVELVSPVAAAFEGPALAVLPRAAAVHAAVLARSRPGPESLPAEPREDRPRITLPLARPDLSAGIRSRHSAMRGFTGDAMPVGALATILAAYGQRTRWDLPANLVEFYCVISDVAGVPAGAYRYLADEHHVELVAAGDARQRLREALLGPPDDQLGARPANVWLVPVGDAQAAGERFGSRWYRMQMAAAGAALHRGCLAGAAIGVSSRIQNNVRTDLLGAWFGLDDPRRCLAAAQFGTEHPGGLRPEFRLTW